MDEKALCEFVERWNCEIEKRTAPMPRLVAIGMVEVLSNLIETFDYKNGKYSIDWRGRKTDSMFICQACGAEHEIKDAKTEGCQHTWEYFGIRCSKCFAPKPRDTTAGGGNDD